MRAGRAVRPHRVPARSASCRTCSRSARTRSTGSRSSRRRPRGVRAGAGARGAARCSTSTATGRAVSSGAARPRSRRALPGVLRGAPLVRRQGARSSSRHAIAEAIPIEDGARPRARARRRRLHRGRARDLRRCRSRSLTGERAAARAEPRRPRVVAARGRAAPRRRERRLLVDALRGAGVRRARCSTPSPGGAASPAAAGELVGAPTTRASPRCAASAPAPLDAVAARRASRATPRRLRRPAHPQALPPRRGGHEPRPRDRPLPHRARRASRTSPPLAGALEYRATARRAGDARASCRASCQRGRRLAATRSTSSSRYFERGAGAQRDGAAGAAAARSSS